MNNYRYYVCGQEFGKINCTVYWNYLEAVKASKVHLSEDTEQTNTIFPVYKKINIMIPINNWIPRFFDRVIIEWKLLNLLNVKFH
jgi:hypothetical protein